MRGHPLGSDPCPEEGVDTGSWRKSLWEVKKPVALLIALAVFVFTLSLYVVPNQGGLKSSTELQSNDLANANTKYEEQLPIQEVGLASSGRSLFIAFVMLSHVVLANLHLGGAWVAVGTESAFLRNRKKPGAERFNRIAKSLTLFNVMLFSAGATFAIAGVLIFIALFPAFSSHAFHIYWWPLLAEALTFAFEVFFLYTYWFTWDRMSKGWHQVLGYAYAIDVFFQTLLINMLASGMLTPPKGGIVFSGSPGISLMPLSESLSWWFNATLFELQFHRIFAAVSFFGFLMAIVAMLHYLDREDEASKRYWDWVGSYGIGIGLFGLIMQPVLGGVYMLAIMNNQPMAFSYIMLGPRAWEMLLVVGLISLLMLACISYFLDRRERILSLERFGMVRHIFQVCFVLAAIFGIILVQPAWMGETFRFTPGAFVNPAGAMIYKFTALFGLIVIGGILVMLDTIVLRNEKEGEWGSVSSSSRISAMYAGIMGMWIVIVMGFFRESARSPWTFFDIVPVPGGQAYPTPIPLPQIFIVWAIILAMTLAIFWFASKVTAYHPEKAEEI